MENKRREEIEIEPKTDDCSQCLVSRIFTYSFVSFRFSAKVDWKMAETWGCIFSEFLRRSVQNKRDGYLLMNCLNSFAFHSLCIFHISPFSLFSLVYKAAGERSPTHWIRVTIQARRRFREEMGIEMQSKTEFPYFYFYMTVRTQRNDVNERNSTSDEIVIHYVPLSSVCLVLLRRTSFASFTRK